MSYRQQETIACRSEASRQRAISLLARAPLVDGENRHLVVILKRESGEKADSAKRKWHGWVRIIAEHTGTEFAVMKRQIKEYLLPCEEVFNHISNQLETEPKRVRDLDDEETRKLCAETKALAASQFDIVLPDSPDEWQEFDNTKGGNADG